MSDMSDDFHERWLCKRTPENPSQKLLQEVIAFEFNHTYIFAIVFYHEITINNPNFSLK